MSVYRSTSRLVSPLVRRYRHQQLPPPLPHNLGVDILTLTPQPPPLASQAKHFHISSLSYFWHNQSFNKSHHHCQLHCLDMTHCQHVTDHTSHGSVVQRVTHLQLPTICVGDNNHTACVTSLYQQFYQQLLVFSLEPFKSRSKESIWHSPSPNTDQWVDRQQVQGGQVVRALDTSLSVSWRQTEPQARDPWGRHQVIQEIILSLSTTMSQFRLVSCHIRGCHHRLTKLSKGRFLTVDLLRPTIATHNNWSSTRLPQ